MHTTESNEAHRGRFAGLVLLCWLLLLSACAPAAVGPPGPEGETGVVMAACRPEGLEATPGARTPYCDVYDRDGREILGSGTTRRVVGYFAAWRTGVDGRPAYLVSDIPWDRVTHVHYAFAHIDGEGRLSIGDPRDPTNPATGMEWPEVPEARMDPSLPYRGHFNLLTRYKREHPTVKTLVSVGGWAETGGHLEDGQRVSDGGFYTMTTLPDGRVNRDGIDTFVRSAVAFMRSYDFDGVDIDYEYPTSMPGAGNPLDAAQAEPRRPYLSRSYTALMKSLRNALDRAGAEDGRYYMLTAAVPASAYLLRGMETFEAARYLDYANVMAYDFHGAWNQYVGHQAPLFDTGRDREMEAWGIYEVPEYGSLGYLNADWAYHYYRGSLSPGRINLGIPLYTRGWKEVRDGRSGLWGTAPAPDSASCPPGLAGGARTRCGDGAVGIDDLWGESRDRHERGGGSNPLWHALNLERGIVPSYLEAFGLDPVGDPRDGISGDYRSHYDEVAEAPWLWNEDKGVFLSIQDERSFRSKLRYVEDRGIGGIALWELAGDYDWHPERRGGKGEYAQGSVLASLARRTFDGAPPYQSRLADRVMPGKALDVRVELSGFEPGDRNYPITPVLRITNRTGATLPGGTEVRFDLPTSTTDVVLARGPGARLRVEESGHEGPGNVGGLEGDFHRVVVSLSPCRPLGPSESREIELVYYLPISGPSNFTITVGGSSFALAFERPSLQTVSPPSIAESSRDCGASR